MSLSFSDKLKTLMSLFQITNVQLARALNVDDSLISRWRSVGCGKRGMEHYAETLGRYFAGRGIDSQTAARLRTELGCEPDEPILPERISEWLSTQPVENEYTSMLVVNSFRHSLLGAASETCVDKSYALCEGGRQIADVLREKFASVPAGSSVDIHLSSESLACATDPEILPVLCSAFEEKSLKGRLLVQSANNSAMCARLIGSYMTLLVQGRLEFYVIQGTPQTFTANMTVIVPDCFSLVITEAVKKHAAVIASVLPAGGFTSDLLLNFRESLRFARPMVTLYDDNFARNIIEIFFEEYGVPGSLDVIKSGLNPMFMEVEDYARVVSKCGHTGEEHAWRVREFARFKEGIDATVASSRFREVLNLSHLRKIAETGSCRMPTIYFMHAGIHYLDREDVLAIFNGYLKYLSREPQFEVALLEDEKLFVENSCWHIKNNRHLMMHSWNIDKPKLVYSDQLMLLEQFQFHYEDVWRRATAGSSRRQVTEEITKLRDLCLEKGKESK